MLTFITSIVQRNFDPTLHPFTTSREYVRALNATKLERVFAKPFLGSLDGHSDGVSALLNNPVRLSKVVTGSHNGEVGFLLFIPYENPCFWTVVIAPDLYTTARSRNSLYFGITLRWSLWNRPVVFTACWDPCLIYITFILFSSAYHVALANSKGSSQSDRTFGMGSRSMLSSIWASFLFGMYILRLQHSPRKMFGFWFSI